MISKVRVYLRRGNGLLKDQLISLKVIYKETRDNEAKIASLIASTDS